MVLWFSLYNEIWEISEGIAIWEDTVNSWYIMCRVLYPWSWCPAILHMVENLSSCVPKRGPVVSTATYLSLPVAWKISCCFQASEIVQVDCMQHYLTWLKEQFFKYLKMVIKTSLNFLFPRLNNSNPFNIFMFDILSKLIMFPTLVATKSLNLQTFLDGLHPICLKFSSLDF